VLLRYMLKLSLPHRRGFGMAHPALGAQERKRATHPPRATAITQPQEARGFQASDYAADAAQCHQHQRQAPKRSSMMPASPIKLNSPPNTFAIPKTVPSPLLLRRPHDQTQLADPGLLGRAIFHISSSSGSGSGCASGGTTINSGSGCSRGAVAAACTACWMERVASCNAVSAASSSSSDSSSSS